jgi:transposase
MDKPAGKHPAQKRYPQELKDRAVRMVGELRREDPADQSVIRRVARQLGVGAESLRAWVKQADVDAGRRGGLSTAEHDELHTLRKEVKELRRASPPTGRALEPAAGARVTRCQLARNTRYPVVRPVRHASIVAGTDAGRTTPATRPSRACATP